MTLSRNPLPLPKSVIYYLNGPLDMFRRLEVNFTNILRAAFALIFLRQKSTNLLPRFTKYKKASRKTFLRKTRAYNIGKIDTWTTLPDVEVAWGLRFLTYISL